MTWLDLENLNMTYYIQAIKAKDKNFLLYPRKSVHSLPGIFFKYLNQNNEIAYLLWQWIYPMQKMFILEELFTEIQKSMYYY
jgi:hypothetical protein